MKYEFINRTIFYANVMNVYFIVTELNYGAIDYDDYVCHGYYVIRFSSFPYTSQEDLDIYVQVIYSSEMVCEGIY